MIVDRSILPCSFSEFMPKVSPVLFNQNSKTLNCPIKRVQNQLCKGTELRCPVPSITTMNNYINAIE